MCIALFRICLLFPLFCNRNYLIMYLRVNALLRKRKQPLRLLSAKLGSAVHGSPLPLIGRHTMTTLKT
jgi:hypothetical protein